MSALFAATYPDRTRGLVIYGSYAKRIRTDDYPWAPTWEERDATADAPRGGLGRGRRYGVGWPGMGRWMQPPPSSTRIARAALRPAAARDLILMNSQVDVRDILPAIRCPTLVLHRTGDLDSRVAEGEIHRGAHPGRAVHRAARRRSCPVGRYRPDRRPDRGVPHRGTPRSAADRVLATIPSPISSAPPSRARDRRCRLVAPSPESPRCGPERLDRSAGRSRHHRRRFLARFDGPARAIRCAMAIREAVRDLGLEIRAGVHTGEVELVADGPRGSPSTSRRGSWRLPRRARSWSARRPATSSRARASASPTVASTPSRGSRARVGSTLSTEAVQGVAHRPDLADVAELVRVHH